MSKVTVKLKYRTFVPMFCVAITFCHFEVYGDDSLDSKLWEVRKLPRKRLEERKLKAKTEVDLREKVLQGFLEDSHVWTSEKWWRFMDGFSNPYRLDVLQAREDLRNAVEHLESFGNEDLVFDEMYEIKTYLKSQGFVITSTSSDSDQKTTTDIFTKDYE